MSRRHFPCALCGLVLVGSMASDPHTIRFTNRADVPAQIEICCACHTAFLDWLHCRFAELAGADTP